MELVDSFEVKVKKGKWKNCSDDELINFIKDYYIKNNKVPVQTDFLNSDYPSFVTYQKRFGNWNNVIKLAGLDSNKRFDYTDDEILESLKLFFIKNGRVPSNTDFVNNSKYPSVGIVVNRFGSWNNAIRKVGLEVNKKNYTDKELLDYLKQYYINNNKIPTYNEFLYVKDRPSAVAYVSHFGSWNKSLKLIGIDIDKSIIEGNLTSCHHKGRLFELYVKKSFKNKSEDLSGKFCLSPFDGICPKGKNYDAKSSMFRKNMWLFHFLNKEILKIDYFYLGAFNKDYSRLLYTWLVPHDFIGNKNQITINIRNVGTYNIFNMKKYEITEKCNFSMFK